MLKSKTLTKIKLDSDRVSSRSEKSERSEFSTWPVSLCG